MLVRYGCSAILCLLFSRFKDFLIIASVFGHTWPTRLAGDETVGPIHRGNAKLFYERGHEASGAVDAALDRLGLDRVVIAGHSRRLERKISPSTSWRGRPSI